MLEFLKTKISPFADGYDIDGEREVLQELIDADNVDPSHPLFERFAEYEARLERLKTMRAKKIVRPQPRVPAQVKAMGALQTEVPDTMMLHTMDAMKLFLGRQAGDGVRAIAGGKRIAASLRQLWMLSGNDNPIADWVLVEFDEGMVATQQLIEQRTREIVAKLEDIKAKGLSYTIKKNRNPATVDLGFVSPYGYAVARGTVEFDYLARVVKSAQSRDVLSSTQAHDILFEIKRSIRSQYEPVVRAANLLMKEELRSLTRTDWLAADEDANRRRLAVTQLIGECPRDVFSGERTPRHTRRSVRLSAEEMALLANVPLAEEASSHLDDNSLE